MEENTEPSNTEAAPQKSSQTTKYAIIVGIIVIAAIALFAVENRPAPSQAPAKTLGAETTSTPAPTAMAAATLKDGTYTAEGQYKIHPGSPREATKKVGVTVTLKNNIITDADVKNEADDEMSERYQGMFIDGYKQFVVGKNINDVHVTKVGGSSLTGGGFNDALEKIKAQAKV